MPSTSDVQSFVINALNQQRPDLARPWRGQLLKESNDPSSLTLLARVAAAEGDLVEALTFTGEAVRIDPYFVDAYLLRASLLASSGAFDEAVRNYQTVLLFSPLNDDAVRSLFLAAQQAQRPHQAIEALTRRLRIGPDHAEFRNLLGLMLHAVGDLSGAIQAYEGAIALDPQAPLYHNNRATILYHLEQYQEALHSLDRSLQLMPDYAVGWQNVGNVYKAMNRLPLAERSYRRAIALAGAYPEAHFNLGCVLLQQNAWAEGWAEYEWRWQVPGLVAPIHAHLPPWQGEPITGERIMVVAEQGSGDTIQFMRYLPKLVELGAEVIVWAPVETAALLRRHPSVSLCATNRYELPTAKYFTPLMSLPRILQSSPLEIPTVPYLAYDQRRTQRFLRELGPRKETLRLGIAWAGNPLQVENRHRSAALKQLAPLFENPSIRWIGLQKGPSTTEIEPSGFPIEDWGSSLESFDTTASLVAALDGVISICSAPIHIAGALGVRSVCMLSKSADWRWCEDESSTNWYASVTLMRQRTLNDWNDVAARTADLIAGWKPRGISRSLIEKQG